MIIWLCASCYPALWYLPCPAKMSKTDHAGEGDAITDEQPRQPKQPSHQWQGNEKEGAGKYDIARGEKGHRSDT